MSYSDSATIDRRDAAVAAALAGLVVVILGYASGLGLQTSKASAVPVPGLSTAPPTASAPDDADTPPAAPGHGTTVHGPIGTSQHTASAGHTQTTHAGTTDPHTDPATPHVPEPTMPPTPAPEPAKLTTSCGPGLLGGLPVAGALVKPVTSLLTPTVGSAQAQTGPLACTVGAVLGPACCATTTTARTDPAS